AARDNKFIMYGQPMLVDAALPDAPPGPGELRWPDGSTRSITVLSAAGAVVAIQDQSRHLGIWCEPSVSAGPACESIHAVPITGARFTTVSLDAVDGPVTTPAWEFTFAGYQTRAITPAVSLQEALGWPGPPWAAYNEETNGPWVTSTSDR